jgi:hypothetical protein
VRPLAFVTLAVPLALVVRASAPDFDARWHAAWDGRHGVADIEEPESALAARVRAAAAGRPIACVGMHSVEIVTGPGFAGRPVYLLVSRVGSSAPGTWRFALDDRDRADHDSWLANLARERPAFVMIYSRRAEPNPVELAWCAADTARFAPWARGDRCAVYAVR